VQNSNCEFSVRGNQVDMLLESIIGMINTKGAIHAFILLSIFGGYSALRRIYISAIGGRKKGIIKVLNRKRTEPGYKKKLLIKKVLYFVWCLPGIFERDHTLTALAFLLGLAFSIFDTIRESNYEYAIEYENGLEYRGSIEKWRDITFTYSTEEFHEIRFREEELYYYIDDERL